MKLEILSDLSEIIPYPIPDFPLFAGIGLLNAHNQFAVGCHCHPDFEFNLVLTGTMDYFINGENVHLETGDGIFVNSQRLHYNYSREMKPTEYLVLTISPKLFPDNLPAVNRFIDERSGIHCTDYLILKKEESQVIFSYYFKILDTIQESRENPLLTLSHVELLCANVLQKVELSVHDDSIDIAWLCLCDMTNYIHINYRDTLMLADIAAAGKVCRSKCCKIFTRYMGQSPIDYLISYRLKKSQELLKNTDCSIQEVSEKCGFNGQSYYAQMFRKYYGITPSDYRKT